MRARPILAGAAGIFFVIAIAWLIAPSDVSGPVRVSAARADIPPPEVVVASAPGRVEPDRKSTRLNSSHH